MATPTGARELVALLGDSPAAWGSFKYNAAALLFGLSEQLGGEPGFAVYVGNALATYGGADALTLTADPLTNGFARQLQGFTLGDYTLRNVRLPWIAPIDFLPGSALPAQLPAFSGTLALDFVLTSDPLGPSLGGNTVFFHGVTLQTAAVPEPSTMGLALGGLALVTARSLRRKARGLVR